MEDGVPGGSRGPLTYWVADQRPLDNFQNWKKTTAANFQKLLVAAADQFPALPHGDNEKQSHVTFFVHGYNNGWTDAAKRYEQLCADLYSGRTASACASVLTGRLTAACWITCRTAPTRASARTTSPAS